MSDFNYVRDILRNIGNGRNGSETEVQVFLILAVGVVQSSTRNGRTAS